MTTPEQLAKLEHAFNTWMAFQLPVGVDLPVHIYFSLEERRWARKGFEAGYLRAKQESEQTIKDARKQALEEAIAIGGRTEYRSPIQNLAVADYMSEIKELLNG